MHRFVLFTVAAVLGSSSALAAIGFTCINGYDAVLCEDGSTISCSYEGHPGDCQDFGDAGNQQYYGDLCALANAGGFVGFVPGKQECRLDERDVVEPPPPVEPAPAPIGR